MTNRTICCLAVSFTAGLLFGRNQNIWLGMAAIAFVLWRYIYILWKQGQKAVLPATLHMVLCLVAVVVGVYHYQQTLEVFQKSRNYAQEQERISVQGNIYWKERKQEQIIYYLNDAGIRKEGYVYPCGRIQVYSSKDSYQIGSCIQADGRYEAFQLPRNEGNFNEEQYYYSKKIGLRIKANQIIPLDKSRQNYKIWLLKVRRQMEQVFQSCMPEREGGILANMVLGSRELADREVKDLYQRAGISHVLAVSGLHVSIFGMGLYRILQRIYCPLLLAAVISAGVVYSFGVLTGMELSAMRAVIMFLLMMTARVTGYTYDTITALGVSAIIQLWENPFALEHAGFLFSYTAVLGAVVVTKILRTFPEKKWKKWILDTVSTSFCIQIVTLPISLFFYYEASVYNILVNGCVLPFMELLLFMGAIGGVAGIFHLGAGNIFLKIPVWILKGCEGVCQFFVGLPGNNLITGKPELEKIILYYVVLAILLYTISRTGRKRYFLGWGVLTFILCTGNQQKGAEVSFLDVGQGDGIFLQSEQGSGFFIDGGSTNVGKVGTYRILPFLKYRGIQEIEIWFVSHTDADHISGLLEVLEKGYPVRNIVFAEGMVKDEAWEELIKLAECRNSMIHYLKAGEKIEMENTEFTVLYPWEGGNDKNETSMVLLTEWNGIRGLFTGDIGEAQERKLIQDGRFQAYMKKGVAFYKGAHHGSKLSNSQRLMEMVSPRITVISCGANNQYGHPGKDAVERIEHAGSQIFYTMKSGQIKIRYEDGKLHLWEFQN